MRIVFFGDIHIFTLALAPWHLLSKRIMGQTNLWLNRRNHFNSSLLHDITRHIVSLQPDLILSSGDLTSSALTREFELARQLLQPLIQQHRLWIIPGNHDRYTFTSAFTHRFERHFGDCAPRFYPAHQVLTDRLHLVAIDACKPNAIGDKGLIGSRQLSDLRELLSHIPPATHLLMLCHYTVGTPPGEKRENCLHHLRDRDELIAILREAGHAITFLHGHVHRPWCWRLGCTKNVLSINAGAPSMISDRFPRGQGFWEIQFDEAADGEMRLGLTRHVQGADGEWNAQKIHIPEAGDEVAKLNPGI